MKRIAMLMAGFAAVSLLPGCLKQKTVPGVGVVDVDKVASAMGWSSDFQAALRAKQDSLQKQLTQVKANFQSQINQKRASLGKSPTDQQKQSFAQMANQANSMMQNAVNDARQKNAQFRIELIKELRDKIKPYVEKVANAKGIGVVLFKTEPVYYISPAADITEDVITKLQAANVTYSPNGPTSTSSANTATTTPGTKTTGSSKTKAAVSANKTPSPKAGK